MTPDEALRAAPSPARFRRRALGALSPLVLVPTGCHTAVLSPAGPVAAGDHVILVDSLAIMLWVVVPTVVTTLAVAWWFRSSNHRARYRPSFTYSGRLELITWSIPVLVVFFLGGIAWISAHLLDPARPLDGKRAPLDVEVVSLDWKWLFIYPQQSVASVNRLVVPVGVPLRMRVTSASVFNVFFVPQLGSEIYSMYGMTNTLYLQADKPGSYLGLAAHFSGDGFPDMHFSVDAMNEERFAAWIATVQQQGPTLDKHSYTALLPQSARLTPYTYRAVSPGLFEAIVEGQLPPGMGPISPASVAMQGSH